MKKIRLAMIGAGSRGGWFIRNKFMPTRFNEYSTSKDFSSFEATALRYFRTAWGRSDGKPTGGRC